MAQRVGLRYFFSALLCIASIALSGSSSAAKMEGANRPMRSWDLPIVIEEICPATVEAGVAARIAVVGDGFTGGMTASVDAAPISVSILSAHIAIAEMPALAEGSHDLELSDGLSTAGAQILAIPSDVDLVFSLFDLHPCLTTLLDQAVEDGLIGAGGKSESLLRKIDHAHKALADFNAAEAFAAFNEFEKAVSAMTGKGLPDDVGQFLIGASQLSLRALDGATMVVLMKQDGIDAGSLGKVNVTKGEVGKGVKKGKGFTCGFGEVRKRIPPAVAVRSQGKKTTVDGKEYGVEFGGSQVGHYPVRSPATNPATGEKGFTTTSKFGELKIICLTGCKGKANFVQVKKDSAAGDTDFELDGGTADKPGIATQWDDGGAHYMLDFPGPQIIDAAVGDPGPGGVPIGQVAKKHADYITYAVCNGKAIGAIKWGVDIEVEVISAPRVAGGPAGYRAVPFTLDEEVFVPREDRDFQTLLAEFNDVSNVDIK